MAARLPSPPPGPFRPGFWRSPLRGPWLTAVLGLVLLVGLPVVIVTGLLSNDAYQPGLGANALGRHTGGLLDVYLFGWPTSPAWLYALTQGLHVAVGLALVPVLAAKLWSVLPRLFEWPPVHSVAHALERLSLALLVGGALFEFVTGILNIQYWYVFPFFFTQAHYYGAWVFIAAFVVHICLKFGTMRASLRTRQAILVAADGLTAPEPAPASMSRRALLGTVAAGSALLLVQGLGQSAGGPLRALALLLPRGRTRPGPLGFPVNKSWMGSGIARRAVGAGWRLRLAGARGVSLSRAQLLALPQHSYALPIACVEGWSTTQRWTGVRLRDLAALCGVRGRATMTAQSLEHGIYGHATLGPEQVADDRALLALAVNGVMLRPRLPGSGHLPGPPRRALHEMGREPELYRSGCMNPGPAHRRVTGALRRRYGASPLHLLGLLASLAVAGAAVLGWFDRPHEATSVLVWFIVAIVAHDLVLVPLYTALDRLAFGSRRVLGIGSRAAAVNPTPFLRIPTMLSALLLGVFFPVIFGLGRRAELAASGIAESGYLARWLLLCAAMYAGSAVAYAVALRRARRARRVSDD